MKEKKIVTIVRELPQAQFSYLRFQVGHLEQRPETYPIKDVATGQYVEDRPDPTHQARIFHLDGFGRTLQAAKKMAGSAV